MDKKLKREWLAALRSGDYKQGKAGLHDPNRDTYCCLGVLCDIARTKGIMVEDTTASAFGFSRWIHRTKRFFFFRSKKANGDAAFTFLPSGFREEAGIESVYESRLVRMNDRGDDFNTIAEYIEREL